MSQHYVTGIDVGTYHVKVVIARTPDTDAKDSNTTPQIIGTGYAESRGLRNGYIINETDVARSVRNAVAQAEKASGVRVKRAYISMGGIGLDEIHARGEAITSRADSLITQSDIDKAIEVSEVSIQEKIPNRKIIHAIPLEFTVDNEKIHGRPHELKGTKLEVDVLFITAFEQHLNDLVATIESIGIKVDDIMASPLAGSLVMLTKAQKRAGCVLANIGAETVSIVVFENNTPISLKVFPIGSNDITNDIALGLKITLDEAEKLKRGGMSQTPFQKRNSTKLSPRDSPTSLNSSTRISRRLNATACFLPASSSLVVAPLSPPSKTSHVHRFAFLQKSQRSTPDKMERYATPHGPLATGSAFGV